MIPAIRKISSDTLQILYLNSLARQSVAPLPVQLNELLVLELTVNGIPCRALIDSGASRNFISTSFTRSNHVTLQKLPHPLRVRLANGSLSATNLELTNAAIACGPSYVYTSDLIATPLKEFDIILGKPFLSQVQPDIQWSTNTVLSPFQLSGETTSPPAVHITLISAKRFDKDMRKARASHSEEVFGTIEINEILAEPEDSPSSPLVTPGPFTSIKTPIPPEAFTPKTTLSADLQR